MVIYSTTLDTQDKVIEQYGGTTWIQHSGYVLRGASSGVTANSNTKTGGNDSVSYTPAGTVDNHTLTAAQSGQKNLGSITTTEHSGHTHTVTTTQKTGVTTNAVNINFKGTDSYKGGSSGIGAISGNGYFASTAGDNNKSYTLSGNTHSHTVTIPALSGSAGSNGKHTHSITISGSNATSGHNHGFTGTASTINTLPQYKSVYIWERVE